MNWTALETNPVGATETLWHLAVCHSETWHPACPVTGTGVWNRATTQSSALSTYDDDGAAAGHPVSLIHITNVSYYISTSDFTELPCSSQKLPSVGGLWTFINLWLSSFHSIAIRSLWSLLECNPLCFIFLHPTSYAMSFQFGLAVTQQLICPLSGHQISHKWWRQWASTMCDNVCLFS